MNHPWLWFTGGSILFVRGETQGGDRDSGRVANPEEMDIGDDEDDDEDDKSDGDDGKGNEQPALKFKVISSLVTYVFDQ